jgi:hypothetical protein
MQEMLLDVCCIQASDLTSRSPECVRETILGYVWD